MAPTPTAIDARPALVIGCGYLGLRAARAWRASGRRVVALTRRRAGELAAAGLEPVVGDVFDQAGLTELPAASTLLYAVGRDRTTSQTMRAVYVDGLRNVLDALIARDRLPGRLLYVSSTSVYGQTDGSWVDETSPTEPVDESGRVVLAAEAVLRERVPAAINLRFAGIYGPGRILRRQALLNGEPLVGDAEKWLNLIHVDDGVRAVLAAEARGRDGETYLIADDEPVRRRELYTRAAELLGGPAARFEPYPPGQPAPRDTNRRMSNRKAKAELGFVPAFPNYREGLESCLS